MRLSNILGLPEERDRDRRLEAKPQIIQLGPGTRTPTPKFVAKGHRMFKYHL